MTDIDTIRERHRPNGESRSFEPPRCHLDNQPWPCDTRVVLDALDEHLSRCIKHDIEVKAERNAARADAERLAEALRVREWLVR